MKTFPATGHPMDMLQTAVASRAMFYPGNEVFTNSELCEDLDYINAMTVKIIARMATLVTMWEHLRNGYDPPPRQNLSYAANCLYMLQRKEVDPLLVRILDVCLILHTEHTLNASTFSARVTGSMLATPYAVIAAAIGTLSAPVGGAGSGTGEAERLAHKGVYPNVDFYSGILYRELGIPRDQFTAVFAIARAAGLCPGRAARLINPRDRCRPGSPAAPRR